MIIAYAKSDIGKAREMNQDAYYISDSLSEVKLYLLADGMGGYKGGEIASNLAIKCAKSYIENNFKDVAKDRDSLKEAIEVAKRNGAEVSGPVPLPTEKEIVTILRAVHKYKDSREQFELRNHTRLIDIVKPSKKLTEELMNIELPAGVDIQVTL